MRPTGSEARPSPRPQAVLISTLAKGVISSSAPWNLIVIGVGIGAIVIAIDEIGRITGRFRFPPLAVGLGIYLPPETTAPAVIGAIFGALYNRWVSFGPNPDAARRLGVLIACGLIVGESLWGVFYAGVIVAAQSGKLHVADPSNPFAIVGDNFRRIANVLAIARSSPFPRALSVGRKARAQTALVRRHCAQPRLRRCAPWRRASRTCAISGFPPSAARALRTSTAAAASPFAYA